jgi:tripartite-type tricarboxylate transporter receptor subunit TctC
MAKKTRRNFVKVASSAGLIGTAGCLGSDNQDSEYPTRDIEVIINWGAGGATDAYARNILAEAIENLGVNAEFRNVTGGAGLRGTGETANSEPDGYTIGTTAPPVIPLSALIDPPDFDITELVPLGGYSAGTYGLWTRPDEGISNLDDLLERYRTGEYEVIGLQDIGDPTHVASLLMRNSDEFDFQWEEAVGYGGSAPAARSLLSGEVPAIVASDGGVREFYREDEVNAVAMLHSEGSNVFEDIPSIVDQGYSAEFEFISRFVRGSVAPPETPEEISGTLIDSIEWAATESDEIQQWEEESGNPVNYTSPEAIGDSITNAMERIPDEIDMNQITE